MRFKHPLFLILLIPLAWLVIRAYYQQKRGEISPSLPVPWKRYWKHGRSLSSVSPRLWHVLTYSIACACFIIALARPQTSFTKIKKTVEGIDLVLVLDLSASMRIEDFRDQSRIDVSKEIIQEFVKGRKNDRMGLLVFSGEAVTLVPPTLDSALLLDSLKNVGIGDLRDGTAIGDAVATGIGRLKESKASSRALILLTDGDSNVGQIDPLTAGELAKGYGIKIYSIAIGREGRVAMPFVYKDFLGRKVKTYQYYDSSINPELLKKISEVTGGKFYRVEDNPKVLRDVFSDIDRLEKNAVESTEQIQYTEKFRTVLEIGLIISLFAFLLQNLLLRVYP